MARILIVKSGTYNIGDTIKLTDGTFKVISITYWSKDRLQEKLEIEKE